MPGGGKRCQVKRNVRTDEPAQPQPRLAYVRDKWLGENVGFGLVCRVGRRFPRGRAAAGEGRHVGGRRARAHRPQ